MPDALSVTNGIESVVLYTQKAFLTFESCTTSLILKNLMHRLFWTL